MALPSVRGHLQTSENWNGTKRCRKDEFSLRLIKLRHPPSPVPRHGCSRSSGLQTRFELHHHSPCLSGLHVEDLGALRSGKPVPLINLLLQMSLHVPLVLFLWRSQIQVTNGKQKIREVSFWMTLKNPEREIQNRSVVEGNVHCDNMILSYAEQCYF